MILILLLVAYFIGVAVDGFLRGRDAYIHIPKGTWHRGDRERAWLASLVWPLSMWLALGLRYQIWKSGLPPRNGR